MPRASTRPRALQFDIVVWMRGKGYDAEPEQNQTADEE